VMFVVPTESPVTNPVDDTEATLELEDDQTMVRPVSVFPAALFSTAVACVVAPCPMELDARLTVTVETAGGVTVTVADPDRPSLVAVIDIVPAFSPVTSPLAETDATCGLDVPVDHVIGRPVSTPPLASLSTAVACVVSPSSMEEEASVTVTVATGGGLTVSMAEPTLPPLVALMLVVPIHTAVASPEALTVAIDASLEVHTTGFVSALPLASLGTAVNWTV